MPYLGNVNLQTVKCNVDHGLVFWYNIHMAIQWKTSWIRILFYYLQM